MQMHKNISHFSKIAALKIEISGITILVAQVVGPVLAVGGNPWEMLVFEIVSFRNLG